MRVVLALLLISGAAAAASWKAMVSPAPLSPGHVTVEGDCDKCHLVFSGVPNEKCLACHAFIADKQKSGQGLHAREMKRSCQECHVDHQGQKGRHTSKDASAAFDHDQTIFALKGQHRDVKCAACHKPPAKAGVERPGPASTCAGCHEDKAHKGALGNNCAACHVATGWKDALKRIADHETPTNGGHEGLGCKDCHAGGRQLSKPGRCISCHSSDEHGGVAISCEGCHVVAGWKPASHSHEGCTCKFPGKHRTFECLACHKEFNFAHTPTLCSGCHDAQRKHEPLGECSRCHTALSWKDNRFDHNAPKSKFLLKESHLSVACNQCHADVDAKGRTQFRAAATDCKACHQAQGDAAHGDFGGCEKCHATTGFDKTTFDHARDARFPLVGKHATARCQSCHAEKVKGYPGAKARGAWWGAPSMRDIVVWASARIVHVAARAAPQTSASPTVHGGDEQACIHCHADPHQGQVGTSCARCHTPVDWKPSTFDVARHTETKLPLTGKHASVDCKSCHTGGQLTGLPIECAGCHVDRHRGKLGDQCQQCHTTNGFKPVDRFDHALTGFAINTQHARVDCIKCHGAEREKDLSAVKGPTDCASCHVANHGAFQVACATCHVPSDVRIEAASGARRLDHRDTGFPLERAHAARACKACHVVNQAPPVARCASCHQDPHGGQAGVECRDCHRPDRFSLVRFDHDRTSFTLRGRHFLTPCAGCHLNQQFVGVRTECFDCHAPDAARAKQSVGRHPFGPTDCRECHRSVWRW